MSLSDHVRALGDDGLQGALLWIAVSSLAPSIELTRYNDFVDISAPGHDCDATLPPLRMDELEAALQHHLDQQSPLSSSSSLLSSSLSSSSSPSSAAGQSSLHDGLTLARRLTLFSTPNSGGGPPAAVPAPKPSSSTATQTDAPPPLAVAPDSADEAPKRTGPFMTAKDKLVLENPQKAALLKRESERRTALAAAAAATCGSSSVGGKGATEDDTPLPPELAHCEKALVEKILSEIVHKGQEITFDEIAGLEFAKKTVIEVVCWPMSRPDLFTGLRALPRGVLLFGPPGTGKTLIGKAIAHQVLPTP